MSMFTKILLVLMAAFFTWILFTTIKNRPELFSKADLSASFRSMGILALILIGVIALFVIKLRA